MLLQLRPEGRRAPLQPARNAVMTLDGEATDRACAGMLAIHADGGSASGAAARMPALDLCTLARSKPPTKPLGKSNSERRIVHQGLRIVLQHQEASGPRSTAAPKDCCIHVPHRPQQTFAFV